MRDNIVDDKQKSNLLTLTFIVVLRTSSWCVNSSAKTLRLLRILVMSYDYFKIFKDRLLGKTDLRSERLHRLRDFLGRKTRHSGGGARRGEEGVHVTIELFLQPFPFPSAGKASEGWERWA